MENEHLDEMREKKNHYIRIETIRILRKVIKIA